MTSAPTERARDVPGERAGTVALEPVDPHVHEYVLGQVSDSRCSSRLDAHVALGVSRARRRPGSPAARRVAWRNASNASWTRVCSWSARSRGSASSSRRVNKRPSAHAIPSELPSHSVHFRRVAPRSRDTTSYCYQSTEYRLQLTSVHGEIVHMTGRDQ